MGCCFLLTFFFPPEIGRIVIFVVIVLHCRCCFWSCFFWSFLDYFFPAFFRFGSLFAVAVVVVAAAAAAAAACDDGVRDANGDGGNDIGGVAVG